MAEAEPDTEPATFIVVRAGAIDRFSVLVGAFAGEGVEVFWDRRLTERRRSDAEMSPTPERRRRDRRGPAPASWALLDFLVVAGWPRVA
jgi:hypothetical protein